MEIDEAAELFYKSSQDELRERLRLRDAGIAFYVAALGTIFTIVFRRPDDAAARDLLLGVPFLSLASAYVISGHHAMIGALRLHTARLALRMLPNHRIAPCWDLSDTRQDYYDQSKRIHRPVLRILFMFFPITAYIVNLGWTLKDYIHNWTLSALLDGRSITWFVFAVFGCPWAIYHTWQIMKEQLKSRDTAEAALSQEFQKLQHQPITATAASQRPPGIVRRFYHWLF